MNEQTTEKLLPRLERVERRNRRLEITGGILALIGALVIFGLVTAVGGLSMANRVIVAEGFVLQDQEGAERVQLTLFEDTVLRLVFLDPAGTRRIVFGLDEEGPAFMFGDFGDSTETALGLLLTEELGARLTFRGPDKTYRMVLALDDAGPALEPLDSNGTRRVHLTVLDDGRASLALYAADGTQRAGLGVASDGTGYLSVDWTVSGPHTAI